MAVIAVDVTARGQVSDEQKDHARRRLASLDRHLREPVLSARVVLRAERNRRIALPARAEAELDVNGRLIRGQVAAETISQAIDQLSTHLERQLRSFIDRRAQLARRAPAPPPGEWFHGAWSPPRPHYSPKRLEERSIVRRKSYALTALDPLEALAQMLDLDHDFFLFHDAVADVDAVVYRREDGGAGLIEAASPDASQGRSDSLVPERSRFSGPIQIAQAVSEMNALSHRFLFFINAESGRGNVIYMRYDGDYGLIEPAD
ncbi:MAG TPA: ribosome-associated translation inhibitor RaiA [Solirubrobacteraceae bacterium]|nr:ribosome-associated translation inhibitor RaiA [Solirubrobacteraceae bacterium]